MKCVTSQQSLALQSKRHKSRKICTNVFFLFFSYLQCFIHDSDHVARQNDSNYSCKIKLDWTRACYCVLKLLIYSFLCIN